MRCVNCQLRLSRLRRHRLSEESDQLYERVQKWIYPRELCRDNFICQSCWELVNQIPNEHPEQDCQLPQLGHRDVCAGCGQSTLRIKSRLVRRPEMSERETLIGNVILEWITPRQLTLTDKICVPCYLKAQRVVASHQLSSTSVVPSMSQHENGHHTSIELVKIEQSVDTEEPPITPEEHTDKIKLPTLRRAADTARRCLFLGCNNNEKRRVPDVLRKRIIKDFKYYIPINSRICMFHLTNNLFHELYAAENAISTFSSAHIEEIVFLLADDRNIDFQNPENIDDHLFKYWFGRTKEEFHEILVETPRLNKPRLKTGFSALLCKMRTRDSNEKLAALFQIPRRTLEENMHQAREILLQDYVPSHQEWEHTLNITTYHLHLHASQRTSTTERRPPP